MRSVITFVLFLSATGAFSQNRLQPGKMYDAGEVLFAPHFGFTDTVPSGWIGELPRESEVFLLTSLTRPIEIFVFASETGSLDALKLKWEQGIDMDAQIKLKAKSASITNGMLTSEVIAVGPSIDKNKSGYAAARCGGFGPCVICLSLMPPSDLEAAKKTVNQFLMAGAFQAPSSVSPYDKFDWKKFLAGKALIAYDLRDKGSKENWVDLCADGTFTAKIDKRGILKEQNPAYKGRLSGTWTAEGIGELGTLILEFKKKNLAALHVSMTIHDEKIQANGERYFVAKSDKCK